MIERSQYDGILTLRLAHGKVNALDVELLEALASEFEGPAREARAVVLTGTGSIFSAGLDLFRATKEGADYVRRLLPLLSRVFRTLFEFPRPVVAAVNGHAIAGGCVMTLACDVRLMAEGRGTIGIPELLVGVPFPVVAMEIVRFAVPKNKIQSLIYLCRNVPPAEALAAGLVDEVVPAEELESRAMDVAQGLAAVPAETYRLTKLALRAEAMERIERTSEANDRIAMEVWTSDATREHIKNFLRQTIRRREGR